MSRESGQKAYFIFQNNQFLEITPRIAGTFDNGFIIREGNNIGIEYFDKSYTIPCVYDEIISIAKTFFGLKNLAILL